VLTVEQIELFGYTEVACDAEGYKKFENEEHKIGLVVKDISSPSIAALEAHTQTASNISPAVTIQTSYGIESSKQRIFLGGQPDSLEGIKNKINRAGIYEAEIPTEIDLTGMKYSLGIVDVGICDEDYLPIIKFLKSNGAKVIALSTAIEKHGADIKEAGADIVLEIPADRDILSQTIDDLLA